MKGSFLDKVAEHLNHHYSDKLEQLVIVLPNRRAGLFLKNYLSNYIQNTCWLPEIISTEELVLNLSNFSKIDNIRLIFHFYDVYKNIEGNKAETFDEFIKWAQALLQDFNEIDQYLIDTKALFSFVNEARALEVWNVDGSEITDTQRNYLEFWKKLEQYYSALKTKLFECQECYQGMAFRWVAEHIESNNLFDNGKQYLFVGFNALNKSEEQIIDYLLRERRAEMLWDADEYYLNDKSQEAGLFLRKFKKKWDFKAFNWTTNHWLSDTKNITITGVNGNINQAYFGAEVLEKLNANNNFQNTALVLADEHLLDPVLETLPDCVEHVNVTMGYALENAPMHSLWLAWIKLHENSLKYSSSKSTTYHYKDVVRILNHPFIKSDGTNAILKHIIKYNWVFISLTKIIEKSDKLENHLFSVLFNPWNDTPKIAVENMLKLIDYFKQQWQHQNKNLNLEFLHLYHKSILQLEQYIEEQKDVINHVKTIKQLFSQLISKESVDFYGEPLKGLQLMGVLETRTLDFENVILLSANEGTIPAGKSSQSFIPFEIKRKFKLPTHIEKDALFAYHFYKLLQRAKNIHLVYNTDVDAFSGSEKSRFITQLQYEVEKANKNIKITEQQLSFEVKSDAKKTASMQKDEEVILQIMSYLQNGISPTAINNYINCPLDFYYKRILKFQEQDEVEEKVEASTMGDVIHKVLENIYTPCINKTVKPEYLKNELPKIEHYVLELFKEKNFTERELGVGKNYLTLKIIVKFITDFITNEIVFISNLNKRGDELTILALEKQLTATLEVEGVEVKLQGIADRIDKIGNTVRIIDYKTGSVEPKDLSVEDLSLVTEDSKYSKCMQLMLYGIMFADTFKNSGYKIVPGIISFRKLSEGIMNLKINKKDIEVHQFDEFKSNIEVVLKEVLNQEIPFTHDKNASYCIFCDI